MLVKSRSIVRYHVFAVLAFTAQYDGYAVVSLVTAKVLMLFSPTARFCSMVLCSVPQRGLISWFCCSSLHSKVFDGYVRLG